LVAVALVGLVACGQQDAADLVARDPAVESGSRGSGGYAIQPFTEVRPGDGDDQVVVGFLGPDPSSGEGCDETYEPEVRVDERNVVVVTLKALHPRADPACARVPREVTVDLAQPLAGRQIREQWTSRRYQPDGDAFTLVPESTPCGRTECSTPSPSPAPCETTAYRAAVDTIDGGIRLASYERCDGSFLILGIDIGSSGCPPVEGPERSPCARGKTAYFVANNGTWRLVTYGGDETTCDYVADSTLIRFPASLCA
jgi:hypothetical protein